MKRGPDAGIISVEQPKSLKILFLTTNGFGEKSGGVVYSEALYEAFATVGVVHVVTLAEAQRCPSRKIRWLVAGLKALLTGAPPNVLFHSGWLRPSVREQLKHAWDLVVLDHLESAFAGPVNSTRLLYISHNRESALVAQKIPRAPALLKSVLSAWVERYEQRIVRVVQGVITISSEEAQWYSSLNTRVRVIPPVFKVTPSFCEFANKEVGSLRLGFLGSSKWQPNVEAMHLLLDQILPRTRRAIELVICGSGWDASTLQQKLNDYGPDSKISLRCLGYVQDISEFWSTIDVFAAPVMAGAGVNVKVCEAMANGRPIIALPHALRGLDDLPLAGVRIAHTPSIFAHEIDTIDPATLRYLPPSVLSPTYAARTIAGLVAAIQQDKGSDG